MATTVKSANLGLFITSVLGLGVSYYAYVVEVNNEKDASYRAMCDFSEHMSCSKVLTSEYGKGFGLVKHVLGEDSVLNQPNCLGGMIFYTIIASLCAVNTTLVARIQVYMCFVSNITSAYLGYILYFILQDLCVVCVTTYILNAISLILALRKLALLSAASTPRAKKKRKSN